MVQLLNLPYSPDLSLRDIFQKNNFSRHDVNSSLKVFLVVPLLSVHSVSPNKSTYLHSESAFFRLETEYQEEHTDQLK